MTSYELRISYWSSDVCSSDLAAAWAPPPAPPLAIPAGARGPAVPPVRSRRRGGSSCGEALLFKVIGKTHQSQVARSEPGHVLLETASLRACILLQRGRRMPLILKEIRADRNSVAQGKSVSVRVDLVGGSIIKKTSNLTST